MKLKFYCFCCLFVLFLSCGKRPAETQPTTNIDEDLLALRSRSLIQILDSFNSNLNFDTIVASLCFDTASSGQIFLRMAVPSEPPCSPDEKQQWLKSGMAESGLLTYNDYIGFTTLRYDCRTIFLLVRKGTMSDIPSVVVDTSLLTKMDSLRWRPTNYKEEFYDAKIHKYRMEHIAADSFSHENADDFVFTFVCYEYGNF